MAKKKASKKKTNKGAAALTFDCHTDPILLESWKSKVNSTTQNDGAFVIDTEDALGYFHGIHINTLERIYGRCSGNGLWFVRPEEDPLYLYKGRFAGVKKLKGKRVLIPVSFQGKRSLKVLAADDWEADKTT